MRIELGTTVYNMLPEKALYQPDEQILIIADLHLGKASHFRKAGIQLPSVSAVKDYQRLQYLMEKYEPRKVYFLGDLFHSDHNNEWQLFEHFIHTHPKIKFTLIKGNHDVLDRGLYIQLGITIIDQFLTERNIIYSHEPLLHVPEMKHNIAGHMHPGVLMRGAGRQAVKLPCFYLKADLLLLPAFGSLTGLYTMHHDEDSEIYAIAGDNVISI